MEKIDLFGFLPESTVNGPGKRAVIWTQGCDRKCVGCWNPESQPMEKGIKSSVSDLIKKMDFDVIQGISFSGGEPFLQSKVCIEISEIVKDLNKDVLCYTGYTYEELIKMEDSNIRSFLELIDILIDGPYIAEIKPKHPLVGSGNQRVLKLSKGEIVEELFHEEALNQECEIIIDKSGNIVTTGF